MAVGRFFFSAALTAQNSPKLHFRFINSSIQPSLVGSLLLAMALVLSIYFTVRKISVPAKNYDVEVSETQEMHNKKSRILASNDFFPVKLHEEHLC